MSSYTPIPSYQGSGEAMARALIESEAPNYYTETYESSAGDDIEVTARYTKGETAVEQLAAAKAKLENYEQTLARIAEGETAPMLLARAVLSGANWDVK